MSKCAVESCFKRLRDISIILNCQFFNCGCRRTTKTARQPDPDAERDDRRCDGPHYRRGHSDGRITDPTFARGGAEQVADGGSREADESRTHTKGITVP